MCEVYQMTFDQYDCIVEKFESVHSPTYYPTIEQLDLMETDPRKWLLFACFLQEKGHKPKSKEEEYRKRSLRVFINEHLELVEDVTEITNPLPCDFIQKDDDEEESI